MSLHFAYGANMSRAVMRRFAPGAQALGRATLADHRFVITADGYASVVQERGGTVHGVLWRIGPRDRVALDGWENVAGGLYRPATLAVKHASRRVAALVYLARPGGEGRPKPGYIDLVIGAAREWELPAEYIDQVRAWSAARPLAAGVRKIGEFT